MAQSDPYSRSYHRFADEYPDIYTDDAAYALWSRLRDEADKAWPSSAVLPPCRKRALSLLVKAELVFPQPGGRYRIRGMDKHRSARQESARIGAIARWAESGGNANAQRPQSDGNATGMHIPSIVEPSREETNRGEHSRVREAEAERYGLPHVTAVVAEAGEAITGQGILSAGERQLTELDRLCETHGPASVVEGMRALANGEPLSWRQLVWGTMKRLEPIPGAATDRQRREDEEAAENERRRKQEAAIMDEPWRKEFRKTLEAHDAGS